jgi:DNA polymerase-3 subunit beta
VKVVLLQENLIKGLNSASRCVSGRVQLPILSHVLLATDEGRLKVSATNLETGVNLWLGAKIEKEGQITIPAKILTELTASLPAEKVQLEVKNNTLYLTCGSYQANFVGLAASEFPLIPTLTKEASVTLDGEMLNKAIGLVAFAAAADEGRPVLTGVLLTKIGKQLTLVATDGYRLSVKNLKPKKDAAKLMTRWDKIKELKDGLIIPARTLQEVARLMGESEDSGLKLAVTPQASQVILALPEAEVVSRLIEGEFPDYQRIIPEKSETSVEVDREELIRAVRLAAIFARESANIIRFKVGKNGLQISANSASVGGNVSEVEAKVTGKPDKIAFNSRYLLDLLGALSAEQITLEMGGSLNPGVFRPTGDQSFTHIIMPVRVQE